MRNKWPVQELLRSVVVVHPPTTPPRRDAEHAKARTLHSFNQPDLSALPSRSVA